MGDGRVISLYCSYLLFRLSKAHPQQELALILFSSAQGPVQGQETSRYSIITLINKMKGTGDM